MPSCVIFVCVLIIVPITEIQGKPSSERASLPATDLGPRIYCVNAVTAAEGDTCKTIANAAHISNVDKIAIINPHIPCSATSRLKVGTCVCLRECMVCGQAIINLRTCKRTS